jgi:hypothetical protein
MMMKKILLVTLLGIATFANKALAQQDYYFSAKGEPFTVTKHADVQGDPYLFDKWLPAKVETKAGKINNEVKVKYDMLEDFLLFVYDTSEEPLKFVEPIKAFTLILPEPLTFKNGFPAINKQTTESYYQVLAEGKATLLKRNTKVVNETKAYNSTSTKTFQIVNSYYLFKDGKMEKIDNPKKVIYALDASKKGQIDAYVNSNKTNFKSDGDLGKIFSYYNSL